MKMLATSVRLVAFSTFWLALTGGAMDALYYGAPAVLLTTSISLALYPATQPGIRLWWAVLYVPHLLLRGFLGGLDVARRVLGSLAAGIRNGALEVHMLDTEDFNLRSLQAEERRVLRLFGMPVVTPRYAGENRGRS